MAEWKTKECKKQVEGKFKEAEFFESTIRVINEETSEIVIDEQEHTGEVITPDCNRIEYLDNTE